MLDKYRPIELDPKIPKEEKKPLLAEWMRLSAQLLKGIKFDTKEFEELCELYGHSLRDRTKELFKKLSVKKVPVLVFSAGLGDMVESLLKHQDVFYDNIHVVSNFIQFNGNVMEGFKGSRELLHVYNKNASAIDEEYFEVLMDRTNILLMGDSLGDTDMAEGAKNVENLLKIGFLYHHVSDHEQ